MPRGNWGHKHYEGTGFKKGHIGYTPKLSEEHKRKIKLANVGKKQSEETKAKIREKRKHQVITEETRKKISIAHTGSKNHGWKGDAVGYHSLHDWVSRWKGTPRKCERCGTETAKKYEWANIDHEYSRVLEDYIRMCTKCHRAYDKSMGIKIN